MCEFTQNIMVSIKIQMRSLSSDGSGGDLQSVAGVEKIMTSRCPTVRWCIVGSKVCVVPIVLPYYHTWWHLRRCHGVRTFVLEMWYYNTPRRDREYLIELQK